MAIPSSVADIREVIKTPLPDSVIEGIIGMVNELVGACLSSSYPTNTAENIFKWMVCHFIQAMDGGSVTQKRAANGASISFEQYGTGEGLKSTPFGRMVVMADTKGCYSGLVADTFLFGVIGDPTRSTSGNC
tara:strand:+ start:605 stop:1000 length:396 start_codon:yes stop_codon:yes gene_type:complete